MISEEQKKQVEKINSLLKYGDKSRIAEKLKKKSSYSEVCEVLKGTYYKDTVIVAALDVIEERERKSKGIQQRIAKRINAIA
jgi:hypothetical protein